MSQSTKDRIIQIEKDELIRITEANTPDNLIESIGTIEQQIALLKQINKISYLETPIIDKKVEAPQSPTKLTISPSLIQRTWVLKRLSKGQVH